MAGEDVAVITANFGGFDTPRGAVEQNGYEGADWFYFWDATQPDGWPPEPWGRVSWVPGPVPRLGAKLLKVTPWAHLDGDYRWIVWLDANMEVHSPHFLHEALASAACTGAPVTTWRHPVRHRIYDEAYASWQEQPVKYRAMPLMEQVDAYYRLGYDESLDLFACGTLIWNMADERTRDVGSAWLAECERWSTQDQLSLPFVAWALGVDVGTFPGSQRESAMRNRLHRSRRLGDWRHRVSNRWLHIYDHRRSD